MSVSDQDTFEGSEWRGAKRRSLLRLAVPVWAFSRARRQDFRKRGFHTSREEILSLFGEELRRPVDPLLRLTTRERRERDSAVKLRGALYD